MTIEFGTEQLDLIDEEDIALIVAMKTITRLNLPYILEDLRTDKKDGKKEHSENIHFTYSVGHLTYDIEGWINFNFTSRWNVTDAEFSFVVFDSWSTSDEVKVNLSKGNAIELIKTFINNNLYLYDNKH